MSRCQRGRGVGGNPDGRDGPYRSGAPLREEDRGTDQEVGLRKGWQEGADGGKYEEYMQNMLNLKQQKVTKKTGAGKEKTLWERGCGVEYGAVGT